LDLEKLRSHRPAFHVRQTAVYELPPTRFEFAEGPVEYRIFHNPRLRTVMTGHLDTAGTRLLIVPRADGSHRIFAWNGLSGFACDDEIFDRITEQVGDEDNSHLRG